MNHYTKDLNKELPVATRVVVGIVLFSLGIFVSALWFITGDPLVGIFGALMGLPCVFAGVGIVLGNKTQTSLSPAGLKVVAFVFTLVGFYGLYQGIPYSGLAWVFAASAYKLSSNRLSSTW